MHPFDIGIAVVLGLFAVRGYARGLFHEIMSLVVFVTGGGVALRWTPKLAARIADSVPGPAFADTAVGFLVLFGLTVMTGRLAIGFIEHMWVSASNSPLNRLGGTVFGIFKGGVLLGCTVVMLQAIPPADAGAAGLRGQVTSPVSQLNERIEGSFLAARLADLTGGLFSVLMDTAEVRVRKMSDDERERP